MKLLLSTLFCLVFFVPFVTAQSGTDAEDIRAILPEGKHEAKLFTPVSYNMTPEEIRVASKFKKYTAKHPDELKPDSSVKDPQYMDKILEKAGFTPKEIKAYYHMAERPNIRIDTIAADSFEIVHKDNIISLYGHGKLRQLDSLQIDLGAGKAVFRGQDIPFIGKAAIVNKDEPMKDVSNLYQYEYRQAPDTTMDLSHMIDNMALYMVAVGRMDATGETSVTVIAVKYVNKRQVLEVMVPFLFK